MKDPAIIGLYLRESLNADLRSLSGGDMLRFQDYLR